MKKQFNVYLVTTREYCAPSTDHYSRSGDWQTHDMHNLDLCGTFDTKKEAKEMIRTRLYESWEKGEEFCILPVYVKE